MKGLPRIREERKVKYMLEIKVEGRRRRVSLSIGRLYSKFWKPAQQNIRANAKNKETKRDGKNWWILLPRCCMIPEQ